MASIRYIRPHFRFVSVGTVAVPVSPLSQHMPVKEFLIQSSASNSAVIYIGPQQNTLALGLELDPGIAYQWGVDMEPMKGGAFPTQYNLAANLNQAQHDSVSPIPGGNVDEMFYDLADFWLISTKADQTVKIYWSIRVA